MANDSKGSGFNKIATYILGIGVLLTFVGWEIENFLLLLVGVVAGLIGFALFMILPGSKKTADSGNESTPAQAGDTSPQTVGDSAQSGSAQENPKTENQEAVPMQSVPLSKCKHCEKEVGGDSAKAYKAENNVFCLDCYKNFFADNLEKASTVRQKIGQQNISMLVGMLGGCTVGIILYIFVGSNVPGYEPYKLPVLIYLTISGAGFVVFGVILLALIGNPVFFVIGLLASFIGAPFYTIYKFIINPVNISRLDKIRAANEEMLMYAENEAAQAKNGGTPLVIPEYSEAEAAKMNALLAELEKTYK